jgi:hypothetical protein
MQEGKRPLGRPRRRWVDNIIIDLREIGWDGVDWIDMAHDRDQWGFCEYSTESLDSIKCWKVLECCTIGWSSRTAQLRK